MEVVETVATGMHHGLVALYTVQLEVFGYVTLYPALAMAGAGQVGAAIALYALKLMALLQMGIKQGDTITVGVEGEDEEQVSADLAAFFRENF